MLAKVLKNSCLLEWAICELLAFSTLDHQKI